MKKLLLFILLFMTTYKTAKEFIQVRNLVPIVEVFKEPKNYQEKFINSCATDVVVSCIGVNLYPSIAMAQMCLESLYGSKHIGQANNYFGFKGNGKPNEFWDGRVIYKDTIENYSGKDVSIKDKFRVYDNLLMSLLDRNRLLQTQRYLSVLTSKTPDEQAHQIRNCGYATDPNYPNKLIWIAEKFGLDALDEHKTKCETFLKIVE